MIRHKVRLTQTNSVINMGVNTTEPIQTNSVQYGTVNVYGEGSRDYEHLYNKPQINGNVLVGNKSTEEIGIEEITNLELDALFNSQF